MPNIRQLDAPQGLGLTPSDRAAESTAAAGRSISRSFDDAASATRAQGQQFAGAVMAPAEVALKFMEHREVSHGAATFANLQAEIANQWNETLKSSDPNDPTVAAKFREEKLEPALDKFSGAFNTEGGQRFGEQKIQSLREHMFTKTAADMSTMAGIAARKNVQASMNAMTNAAFLDPTLVPSLLKDTDHSIAAVVGSSPTMNPIDQARVSADISESTKQAIVRAAAVGDIQRSADPEAAAAKWISKYPNYIGGDNAERLLGEARQQVRAARADDAYRRTIEKQQQQDKSDARENEYFAKINSNDPKVAGSVNARDVANDPDLTRESRQRVVGIIERKTQPETDAKISAQNTVSIFNWMRQSNADALTMRNRVDQEYGAGQLSWGDREKLMKEIEDRKTPAGLALAQDRAMFFKQYAGAIAGRSYDPAQGSPKIYAAEMAARRVEEDLKRKGLDPHLAYDPTSREYFIGEPGRLQKLQGTMQSDLGDRAGSKIDKTAPDARPTALRGIADLSYSKTRNIYRDNLTGKLYRPDGTEVTP